MPTYQWPRTSLTVFVGRAGDHNDLAMAGSAAIGADLSRRLALDPVFVGASEPSLNTYWDRELAAALPILRTMSARYEQIFASGNAPVSAISRCAVALATLPVVARHRPDAVVVWFDAHADLNTPDTTATGYLGGLTLSGPLGMWDSGLGQGLAPANVILGGVRDIDPPERQLLDDVLIRLVKVGMALPDDLRQAVAGRPVYFHLDCDVLEPGIVPTDYRVPGGLTLDDLRAVAEVLAESEVVGVEIGEFEASWRSGQDAVSPGGLLDALTPVTNGPATALTTRPQSSVVEGRRRGAEPAYKGTPLDRN